jgi:signal transduction histidine kinase
MTARVRWDAPATWAPEAVLAALVLAYGLLETVQAQFAFNQTALLLITLGFAAATGLSRHAPAAALAIVWLVGACQLLFGVPIMAIELSVAVVGFGCARWGRWPTVLLSGLSIPGAAAVVAMAATTDVLRLILDTDRAEQLASAAYQLSGTWQVGAAIIGMLALAVPWVAGLALRAVDRARRSEESEEIAVAEAVQAQEIARLREDQARLARDVHDVVGHSLAVILAQAESAQYLPDDPADLKATLETIATSARTSLHDVRQVLAPATAPTRPGGLDDLVAGVRSAGQEVVVEEVGAPRPLPPELEVVAYRVMQEMLTNAVKHGRRDQPIRVERHWPQDAYERDLRLEVTNHAASLEETQPISAGGGSGIDGMRRRVESAGGRLDVRRRGESFTATAWVPVRA